ncbi:MAG: P1 family peptidase [Acidobacteriota bacterium]
MPRSRPSLPVLALSTLLVVLFFSALPRASAAAPVTDDGAPAAASRADAPRTKDGLTAVAGIRVGQHTRADRPTGVTVVLAPDGAVGGVDVRGGAPGTREIALLDPVNTVDVVHAVVLSGGSAFGLDAASGVVAHLEAQGIGYDVGVAKVPIVVGAILFDLAVGDARIRPTAEDGRAAAAAASAAPIAEGSVGAGLGAQPPIRPTGDAEDETDAAAADRGLLRNTTIAVVATDARLTKAQITKVAQMAHDGLARTLVPVHTPWDGDTVFALATGRVGPETAGPQDVLRLGALAAEVLAEAVVRGVRAAEGVEGVPGLADPP